MTSTEWAFSGNALLRMSIEVSGEDKVNNRYKIQRVQKLKEKSVIPREN